MTPARACSFHGSFLNEVGQTLAIPQATFDLLANGKLDTDGRQLRRLHGSIVLQMLCIMRHALQPHLRSLGRL